MIGAIAGAATAGPSPFWYATRGSGRRDARPADGRSSASASLTTVRLAQRPDCRGSSSPGCTGT